LEAVHGPLGGAQVDASAIDEGGDGAEVLRVGIDGGRIADVEVLERYIICAGGSDFGIGGAGCVDSGAGVTESCGDGKADAGGAADDDRGLVRVEFGSP